MLFTVATLTGHAVRSYGTGYSGSLACLLKLASLLQLALSWGVLAGGSTCLGVLLTSSLSAAVMDNGPARQASVATSIAQAGEMM